MARSTDSGHFERVSRRGFLQTTAATAAALTLSGRRSLGSAPPALPTRISRLSEHLFVDHGPINVGIIRDGEKALLIDCGDGSVRETLAKLAIRDVEQIVFTHHHRDQACGAHDFAVQGAKMGAPASEREHFENPSAYWNDDKNIWRVYRSFRPHSLMLAEPLRVDAAWAGGHELTFGPAKIRVLDTPGHTEGAVSYLVEVDGQRVVFCGDCIYDEGQVWDIYSLQKGFSHGGAQVGGYHGFMGDRWQLVESLQQIKKLGPQKLVPSHGNVMVTPAKAIDKLIERFETCYERYVAISALRHYFPKLFADYAGRPRQMPIRPGTQPPDCLRHFGTTWMLVSQSGAAFVMDVGSPSLVDRIKTMLTKGEIKSVEGLWVTHYHFDHTDGIPKFQQEFDCPCMTDRQLAEVLIHPKAWRLPCLAPEPVRVHRPMEDGQTWSWHEFKMTSYFFPGQSLYHSGLLVERGDLRMFFAGDSHTMSGIDDYCAYNRNFLGRGVGFQYCISLIEKLKPTHIFNCHVNDAFTFTPEEIRFMRQNLDEREQLFGELVPWDHANYGMDASWIRCYPYTQQAHPGDSVRFSVVITNHSSQACDARCRAVLPKAIGSQTTPWVSGQVLSKQEKPLDVVLSVPATTKPGRYVIPVDVEFGPWRLPQFAEAVVDV
jgi:glyoxylase-like metal-dependent hydrolase (beta-lactamase superfamily II)